MPGIKYSIRSEVCLIVALLVLAGSLGAVTFCSTLTGQLTSLTGYSCFIPSTSFSQTSYWRVLFHYAASSTDPVMTDIIGDTSVSAEGICGFGPAAQPDCPPEFIPKEGFIQVAADSWEHDFVVEGKNKYPVLGTCFAGSTNFSQRFGAITWICTDDC